MDETTILILLLTILVIIVYSFYFINIKKCKKKTKEKFTDTDTCDRGNGWQNGGTDFCGDDNAFVCFIRRLVCYIKDLTTKKANVNNCMTDANVNCRQKIAENNPNKYCYAQPGKKCTNSQNDGEGSCDDCNTQNCPAGEYADKTRYGVAAQSCTACPAHSNSAAGSTLKTSCVCDSAYTGSPGGPCTSNPSSGGSGGATATDCPPGQTGEPGSCSNCPAGTYKTGTGNAPCISCLAGTYSDSTGASTCKPCLAGTYSDSIGATAESTCETCLEGTYSDSTGATSELTCTPCGTGQTSPEGSADVSACSGSSASASGNNQLLTSDTPGAIAKSNDDGFICKPGFYQKYDAAGNSLDQCDYCPPNYYCPGEQVGQDNIVSDGTLNRGAGLKVCPMRANTDEDTALGEAWTYSQYQTFTCGSDFNRNIDFWSDDYDTREGTSLKKYCSYDLLNGNSEFEYVRGGSGGLGKMNCANQYLNNGGDNYQCNLQVSEDDCLKLYNVQSEQTQNKNNLMTNKCSTTEPVLPDASNIERERYCCPNSRTPGDDKTGTYAGSLLGGSCQ